jgi:anoctamin-10
MRWNVQGVGNLKLNRPQFRYEQEIVDSVGRVIHVFPRWKRIARQLFVVPFLLGSTALLGILIACVFAIETFIGEAYEGPYKFYLVSLPTRSGNFSAHLYFDRLTNTRSIYLRFS